MTALTDRTAVVTGASKGIGAAIAERLGRDGAHVAVHYGGDRPGAEKTLAVIREAGGAGFLVQADLAEPHAPSHLADQVGNELRAAGLETAVHVIVNNAGIGASAPLDSITREDQERLFAVNVHAPVFLLQALLPVLADGGRVINVSSGVTRIAMPSVLPYAMTKGALETLTFQLAEQLGPRGITVNAVSPGIVDTASNAALASGDPEAYRWAAEMAALKRIGEPRDIADVVGFLASDDGRWVTGQVIDATGGSHL